MLAIRQLRGLGATALALTLGSCAVNPATGERQLSFISESQEIQMGREADAQIVQQLGLYADSSVQRYVRGLGERLAAVSERPDLPWTFRVVDDHTVNAFAVPGGFIYITRGIMAHLSSEAQLVGILGHEIGHVTARHSVNQMSRQQLLQVGLGVGMILSDEIAAVGDIAGAGLQVLSLKFSRDDETQSDELGIRYMQRVGYDPRELAEVMRMLESASRISQGSGRVPEWLSTHPDPANRVEHIRETVASSDVAVEGSVVDRAGYLGRLDGMVFGPDPREGFFADGVFHHPELRFRIDVPSGWQKVNTKSAVQAVPEQGDAVLLLTLDEGTPGSALDRFAGQDGVSVGSIRAREVNGLNAALAPFTASVEGGTLRGEVLFVSHRGTTYRVLGYTTDARWNAYQGLLGGSLRSFRPETDPDVLAAEPDRLDVVELGQSLSFDGFMERYPSSVRPEVVAVINQVEAGATFPAGSLAKRVSGGRSGG